jgi:hypothetical protein
MGYVAPCTHWTWLGATGGENALRLELQKKGNEWRHSLEIKIKGKSKSKAISVTDRRDL